jgi:uncharacterized protein (TIGR02391 family)
MRPDYLLGSKAVGGFGDNASQVSQALSEAWSWLEREALVVRRPWESDPIYTFSRHAKELKTKSQVAAYVERSKLPKELLHPSLRDPVWSLFLTGKYETAVFEAFKEIEVSVRVAGGFGHGDIGVPLMQKAFGTGGKLADPGEHAGEQDALRELFSGAIGRFKNPASHRHQGIVDAREAFEMLVIASHLMQVVLDRAAKIAGTP